MQDKNEPSKNQKRYYWLKLPKSYFCRLDQKKMRKQEHGKDMQIVYLRMMLLGVDKGGYIYYQGVYDSLEEELAEEFDEPVEIIKETLDYLKENNMISIDENSDCFVPEALDLTGSEGASAKRMRDKRNRDKTSQCDKGVTKRNTCVTASDVEKEIEKEIDIESNNKNTLCKADALALFERLWKLYPVKKGKGNVSDTQKIKLLKIGYDEMKRAIERYKRYVESVDYLHYKNGSTFFNSGYVDYLDKNYQDPGSHYEPEPEPEEELVGDDWFEEEGSLLDATMERLVQLDDGPFK